MKNWFFLWATIFLTLLAPARPLYAQTDATKPPPLATSSDDDVPVATATLDHR